MPFICLYDDNESNIFKEAVLEYRKSGYGGIFATKIHKTTKHIIKKLYGSSDVNIIAFLNFVNQIEKRNKSVEFIAEEEMMI